MTLLMTTGEGSHPNKKASEPKTLGWDDFVLGVLLGTGSFASVHQIKPRSPSLLSVIRDESSCESSSRSIASDNLTCSTKSERSTSVLLTSRLDCRFALKKLNEKTLSDRKAVETACQGLCFEAQVLSNLPRHENIIALQGISSNFFEDPVTGFLVLEYLNETLEERLKRWRNRKAVEKDSRNLLESCQRFVLRSSQRANVESEQRTRVIHIGVGIAKAMAFLHRHQILYRDLKPSNIGFDPEGVVRLFDFGLARYYKKGDEDDRRLTLCVGSLRYMAPEVMNGKDYDFAADVHSFAILLWEICTLGRAFSKARSPQQLLKMAVTSNDRPSVKKIASPDIKELLQASWHPNSQLRPSFALVVDVLQSHKSPKRDISM